MQKAILNSSFTLVEWVDDEVWDYSDELEDGAFKKGDEVEVVRESGVSDLGDLLYLIYNPRINDATVVRRDLLDFIK